jgi:hypothetical protein
MFAAGFSSESAMPKEAFQELMETPDHAIPHELLESAKCVAIIPGQKKAGFVVAAEYGKGVAMCRTEHGWSGPVFLTLAGGGIGLQSGGASTDVVMVFGNREGFEKLLSDKFKIGADATAPQVPWAEMLARRPTSRCTPRFLPTRAVAASLRALPWMGLLSRPTARRMKRFTDPAWTAKPF